MKDKPTQVADDTVVSLNYVLSVDGEVVDSTDDNDPIEFLQGHREVIPGLEQALYGMGVGDSKSVVVAAEDAYGETDPEAVMEIPRNEFPDDFPLEPGVDLEVRDHDGRTLLGTILSIETQSVKVDFNHPLAGKDLHFDLTVSGLRPATAEEISHGHVHEEGHQHS
jgi:FKBP-type peptidyl-prolyl cis-trans isomerase SlyD